MGFDAGADAGPIDMGFDAGPIDMGSDVGPIDMGFDAGTDTGPIDLGFDAGPDTGPIDLGFDAGPDTGFDSGPDTGPTDAGPIDSGFDAGPDTGPIDLGIDSGVVDAGPSDTGASDLGAADSGPEDTFDAGPSDTGASDIGAADSGPQDTYDAGSSDTGVVDLGPADIGPSDTSVSDVPLLDGTVPDTGASTFGATFIGAYNQVVASSGSNQISASCGNGCCVLSNVPMGWSIRAELSTGAQVGSSCLVPVAEIPTSLAGVIYCVGGGDAGTSVVCTGTPNQDFQMVAGFAVDPACSSSTCAQLGISCGATAGGTSCGSCMASEVCVGSCVDPSSACSGLDGGVYDFGTFDTGAVDLGGSLDAGLPD